MTKQKITSAETCVKKLPAAFTFYKKALAHGSSYWAMIDDCLDYGGGKYDVMTDALAELGVRNWVYDPYNRPAEHNAYVYKMLSARPADMAFCNNVLNVIREKEARLDVIKDVAKLVRMDGDVIFSVYEGDKSGKGKKTSKGWQNNRKLATYAKEIKQVFACVEIVAGKIIRAGMPKDKIPESWGKK